MTVHLGSHLKMLYVETEFCFNLLALLDAVKQMLFSPIVRMVFCDFLKELYTQIIPTDNILTHSLLLNSYYGNSITSNNLFVNLFQCFQNASVSVDIIWSRIVL